MFALVGGPAALLLAMWKFTTVPTPYALSGMHAIATTDIELIRFFIFIPPLDRIPKISGLHVHGSSGQPIMSRDGGGASTHRLFLTQRVSQSKQAPAPRCQVLPGAIVACRSWRPE